MFYTRPSHPHTYLLLALKQTLKHTSTSEIGIFLTGINVSKVDGHTRNQGLILSRLITRLNI